MNWENCDDRFEEEKQEEPNFIETTNSNDQIRQHNDAKNAIQLQKFQNPSQNPERQKYIHFLREYGALVDTQDYKAIFKDLLTEDCDVFVFNMRNKERMQYYSVLDNLNNLHPGVKILTRFVRETYVDVLKRTAIQLSTCHLFYDEDQTEGDEIIIEIFTFGDDRVSKYRISFGNLTPAHGPGDPLDPTRKDWMISKVKEINYALVGQPDLEKLSSLFEDTTEYKICSWEMKYSEFNKNNLVSGFPELEESYRLNCIVPYEIYSEADYIAGTYVYRLENKITGESFMWLTTAIYRFDKDIKLSQILQHGELFKEGEVEIPFKSYTREKLQHKLEELIQNIGERSEFLKKDGFSFDCDIVRLGPFESPNLGRFQGLNQLQNLADISSGGFVDFNWVKVVDLYVDFDGPCYDVAILLNCAEGVLNRCGTPYSGKIMNFMSISRSAFENGRPAKTCQFYTTFSKQNISPYDNEDFEAMNIIKKKRWIIIR